MAKTKKEVSTTAFDAVESTNVENQEASVVSEAVVSETKEEIPEVKETKVSEPKEKKTEPAKFYDDETVKVKSEKRAGKTITATSGKPIKFDDKGVAEVIGIDAKYLLSVPGFELVK